MKATSIIFSLVTLLGAQACSDDAGDATPAPQDTGCGMFCLDDTGATLDTSEDVTADSGGDTAFDTSADSGSTPDTGSSAERAAIAGEVRALCTAQRRHLCKLAANCDGLAEIRAVFEQLGGIDTASCAEAIAGLLTPECSLIAAGIESGRVTVDRAAVAACMPELGTEDCETQVSGVLPVETACTNGVIGVSGQQADGTACAAHVECANGLRCTSNNVEGVEGVCEPAEAAACTTLADCPNAFYCSGVSASPDGVGGCTARLGEGARCNDIDACLSPFACVGLGETDPDTGRPVVATCARFTP